MENKHERYQKAMNIIDVLEGLFRLGSITDGKLFVEVKSAVVRQGILFRQSELLAAIQPTYPEVKGFEIKINPELTY